MNPAIVLAIAAALPVVAGLLLLFCSGRMKNRTVKCLLVGLVLVCSAALVLRLELMGDQQFFVWDMTTTLHIAFVVDNMTRIFGIVTVVAWTLGGIYAFEYMKHEENEDRYFGFYLIAMGVLICLAHAGNLITLYLFFEMMTLTTLPMVLHSMKHEAIMAGLKYMFYSVAGAFCALFGIFYFYNHTVGSFFRAGGVITEMGEKYSGTPAMTLLAALLMIIGFGAKAGMFPLHGWLPTAHPVAPAPASAVLSGVITKFGVLSVIRIVYYTVGPDYIRGTYVQYAWMILSLITVFMGSMMAYREKVLKKRMAYSTVSQVSYIMFGLSVLNVQALTGALAHVIFHSAVKNTLFLVAGAIIYKTGRTRVEQLRGIGKEMPITMWCFTLVSVALIGIPPTSGFISKWYLATGSLESGMGILSWFGPVVLLLSAMLTAGYLLSITIKGFFPGNDYDYQGLVKKEPNLLMLVPMILFTIAAVGFGMFPTALINFLQTAAAGIL
ncbi:MAG: proton-conducting transporter membrane subunit [Lachnospiraceae bacterium]|nr:proton-conducting transporter membrane subunit [Lachnospiraceae bacterium]